MNPTDPRLKKARELLLSFMVDYAKQTLGCELPAFADKHTEAIAAALPREVSEEDIVNAVCTMEIRDVFLSKDVPVGTNEVAAFRAGARWALEKASGE